MAKQIYVNLPIKDINKSKKFFSSLGFSYKEEFTDEKSLCLIINENIYVMLLLEKFFKDFIHGKEISDTSKNKEVLIGIDVDSKEEVDIMIKDAVVAGGKEFGEAPQDHGWMYGRSFEDLDGHVWEILFMDESKMPEAMRND
jgi:uncharacterized protein